MFFIFTAMGMNPKTKAECDRCILQQQKAVNSAQDYLAAMKSQYGANSSAANNAKCSLVNEKGKLAELKALRKTLP